MCQNFHKLFVLLTQTVLLSLHYSTFALQEQACTNFTTGWTYGGVDRRQDWCGLGKEDGREGVRERDRGVEGRGRRAWANEMAGVLRQERGIGLCGTVGMRQR